MYRNWPNADQIRMSVNDSGVNGAGLSVDLERDLQSVPGKVEQLLVRFGWSHSETCPNTKEQLWCKVPSPDAPDNVKAAWDSDLQNCHWYWYEAMAYEFGKFIGIGDDVDWSKSQGSAGMGSVDASTQR